MDHLFIVTGSSQGLGLALAQTLLGNSHHRVIGIARHTNAALQDRALTTGAALSQLCLDLSLPEPAAANLESHLKDLDTTGLSGVTLINNAAQIPDIAPLSRVSAASVTHALRVGLEAPVLLTAAFLRATASWRACTRRVLNISSGLGRRPMAAQATYCAVKAGLDHFTRCLALEQQTLDNPARVCSLAPGVIATHMQEQMRATADADFPDRAAFVALHASGTLQTPEQAARNVLAYLNRTDFGTHPVADIRDA